MQPGSAAEVKARVRQQEYGSGAASSWVVKGRSGDGREGTTVEEWVAGGRGTEGLAQQRVGQRNDEAVASTGEGTEA